MGERVNITADEAIGCLDVHNDRVHAVTMGGMWIGADWDAADVRSAIRAATRVCLTGPTARSTGHGIACARSGVWFAFATVEAEVVKVENAPEAA